MQLLQITNGTTTVDLTSRITVPNYQVNRFPVYTSWTDGYGISHRDITRYQMSGSFTVFFESVSDYTTFIELLKSAINSEGYYSGTVYANNEMDTHDIDFYLDISPINDLPQLGRAEHDGIDVTLTER